MGKNSYNIHEFFSSFENIYKIAKDKRLSRIGDNVVNLAYSLAVFISTNKSAGKKVPGKILSSALRGTRLREYAGRRRDAHGLADVVEALVGYCWLKKTITIDSMVEILVENMGEGLQTGGGVEVTVKAFKKLLEKIDIILTREFNNRTV
ncbi:MAG: ribonuclease III family protein [Candidatus Odinarchaeota archaeon]